MAALGTLAESIRSVIIVVVVFFAGSIAWAAVSGILAGILDVLGVVIPGPMLVAASPVVGLLAVGYAIQQGWAS